MTLDDRRLPELFSMKDWQRLAVEFGLPRRQIQIARLICRGLTNAEIAVELGTATETVRMHTRVLYRRLNVRSRVGVAVRLVTGHRTLTRRKPCSP